MPTKGRAGLRILILEDDLRDAELEAHALRRVDPACAVQVVDSRGAFTHALDSFAPDVILSDSGVAGFHALDALHLLQSNGLQVLSELRRHPRTWALPLVLLTSSNLEHDVAESYRLGANSFVQKPLEFTKFRDLVRRLGEYWLTINEPPPAFEADPPSVEALPEPWTGSATTSSKRREPRRPLP